MAIKNINLNIYHKTQTVTNIKINKKQNFHSSKDTCQIGNVKKRDGSTTGQKYKMHEFLAINSVNEYVKQTILAILSEEK